MSGATGRNIVLLSDGTGNSSVSPTKSNVWRLYQALDLGPGAKGVYKQFAFYDDGVGTSGFRPLMLLGGAFGWGLSRNVRQLYENLCRHYTPGDRVYIFGFSRGAFTARVLAHFICTCGILDRGKPAPRAGHLRMESDEGLRLGVKLAYKSYRRGYWDDASWFLRVVSLLLRLVRNRLLGLRVPPPDEFMSNYSHEMPDGGQGRLVEFIGVWDTVDAVGLPVEELASFVDLAIYPYMIPNMELPGCVARARHALAVDDERHSFHPLLWNEYGEDDPDRIKQVWFAGMHSNVGGSYPEDHLAYIALNWMIGEAGDPSGKNGLIFNDLDLKDIRLKAQPVGKMYNSRRGAAVYYRYKPRRIQDLCHDNCSHSKWLNNKKRSVCNAQVRIHHTVLDRIADSRVGYSPTGLPGEFVIIGEDGQPVTPRRGSQYYEPPAAQKIRVKMLDRAQNHIFWRRVNYFFLLAITLFLAFVPQFWPPISNVEAHTTADLPGWLWGVTGFVPLTVSKVLVWLENLYMWLSSVIAPFVPALVLHWTEAWAQSPGLFTFLLLLLAVFYAWSGWIVENTQRIAEAGWWHVKKHKEADRFSGPPKIFEAFAGWLQGNSVYRCARQIFVRIVIPAVFLVFCLYLLTGTVYRIFVHQPFVSDGVCSLESAVQPDNSTNTHTDRGVEIIFDTRTPCHDTEFLIEAGRKYTITVSELPEPEWSDAGIPAGMGGLDNFLYNFRPGLFFSIPARRHVTKPWFSLLGEIGTSSGNVIPLNRPYFTFTAPYRGRFYVFVNDVINPGASMKDTKVPDWIESFFSTDWNFYYTNNTGQARITVTAQD